MEGWSIVYTTYSPVIQKSIIIIGMYICTYIYVHAGREQQQEREKVSNGTKEVERLKIHDFREFEIIF